MAGPIVILTLCLAALPTSVGNVIGGTDETDLIQLGLSRELSVQQSTPEVFNASVANTSSLNRVSESDELCRSVCNKPNKESAFQGGCFTNRGTDRMAQMLGSALPWEKLLAFALPSHETENTVLELGCGEGVVLLELQHMFPRAHMLGINSLEYAKSCPGYCGSGPVSGNATPQALDEVMAYYKMNFSLAKYPDVSYGDYSLGRPLDYPNDSVDLVISQHALNQGKLKNPRVEFPSVASEVMRVMRIGGWALLHAAYSDNETTIPFQLKHLPTPNEQEAIQARMQVAGTPMLGIATEHPFFVPIDFVTVPVGPDGCADILFFFLRQDAKQFGNVLMNKKRCSAKEQARLCAGKSPCHGLAGPPALEEMPPEETDDWSKFYGVSYVEWYFTTLRVWMKEMRGRGDKTFNGSSNTTKQRGNISNA